MRYGSLFAGAGGVDLGFDAAGWECAWQVEIDPHAHKVLEHWWPEVARHDDITRCVGAMDRQLAGGGVGTDGHLRKSAERLGESVSDASPRHLLEPVDLIVGGFPCQDLSVAGGRAGMVEGTRSGLFFEFVRIVEEMRDATAGTSPRWVVWENVAGLLSLGNTLGSVYAAWDGIGAVVQEHRLIDTGRAFGVPQRRRRVLGVVGFDPRAESAPAVLADPESVRRDPQSSDQAGQDVAALTANGVGAGGGADDNAGQAWHLIPIHSGTITANWSKDPGNTQVEEGCVIPFDTTQITSAENRSNPGPGDPCHSIAAGSHAPAIAHSIANRGREGGTQAELGEPDIANTLRAGDGGSSRSQQVLTPDLAVRRLTPTECERLMGWPDGHTEPAGADSHRYRLCGNGVIAPAATWLARRIERTQEALL